MSSSNHQKFEIVAVLITAFGKFIFYDLLDQRLIFIVLMFAFWSVYLYCRVQSAPDLLKTWGFRTDNFKTVLKSVLPFGIFAVVTCLIVGYVRGSLNPHWHIIPILIIYPLFGTLQQFLLMSLVAGNMQTKNMGKVSIIVLTSVLFGVLHYPYGWLIGGTFILSLFYTHIYLRERNLYVLGLFHGWLGAIFYYTVVNEDPFYEVFKPLL